MVTSTFLEAVTPAPRQVVGRPIQPSTPSRVVLDASLRQILRAYANRDPRQEYQEVHHVAICVCNRQLNREKRIPVYRHEQRDS